MAFCSLFDVLDYLICLVISSILLLPWLPLPYLLSYPSPRNYSSQNSHLINATAISSPRLVEPTQGLRCFEFGQEGNVVRVKNHTAGIDSRDSSPCRTCERYRYFEYPRYRRFDFADFSTLIEYLESPNPLVKWPLGGRCLDHALPDFRPDGCYLLVYIRSQYWYRFFSKIVRFILGIDAPTADRDTHFTMNSMDYSRWLSWELASLRFLIGEIEAVHHICYCRQDLCNGDFDVVVMEEEEEGVDVGGGDQLKTEKQIVGMTIVVDKVKIPVPLKWQIYTQFV